jgi:hypothetical protein
MSATLLLPLLYAGGVCAQYIPVPWAYTQNEPPVKVTVDAAVRHQTMIGGGCSGAFGVACDQTGSRGLSPSNQQLVSDYLFNENLGGPFCATVLARALPMVSLAAVLQPHQHRQIIQAWEQTIRLPTVASSSSRNKP